MNNHPKIMLCERLGGTTGYLSRLNQNNQDEKLKEEIDNYIEKTFSMVKNVCGIKEQKNG